MAQSYDPERVTTTLAEILIQGAMGDWITIEFDEDAVTLHKGTQGATAYTENAIKSAIATITIDHTSLTNDLLSAFLNAKRKGPFFMKDFAGGTVVEANDARLQKMTPIKRGKEIMANEWKIILPRCIAVAGGNL